MNYEYDRRREQQLKLNSVEEELLLGLQICGELLIQSKDVILGALAYRGWVEYGRCFIIVDLPAPTELTGTIELPMRVISQNDLTANVFGAEELVEQYNTETEGVLVIHNSNLQYNLACACIFTPSLPPRVCLEELISRPEEFDCG